MKRLCYFLVMCSSFWWIEYASAVDWLGDVPVGETINFCFNTLDSAGEPVAIVETGISIEVYEDGGTTQITAGDTLSQAFDSVVGLHNVALVCTGANGYEAGKYYSVVIAASTSATADGVDIVGRVIGRFRCVEAENVAGTPAADITYVDGSAASSALASAADIADAVHDEALSGHTTAGTAGKALADIETDATAILTDTDTTIPNTITALDNKLGVPPNLGSGATLGANLNDISGLITTADTVIDNIYAAMVRVGTKYTYTNSDTADGQVDPTKDNVTITTP